MRVAIFHFHLRAGGVTRVIEMAAAALAEQGCDVLVVSGEPAPPSCRVPSEQIAVVPELRYGIGAESTAALREGVEAAMRRQWGATADLLHFHNHALGKNFALPPAVSGWAEEGGRLVLQVHDFAEDGRPGNYRKLLQQLGGFAGLDRHLYPAASQVAYALLNTADLEKFPGSSASFHVLPNPAVLPPGGEPVKHTLLQAEKVIVYPTRAIRRKNIGEAVLWAAWAEPGTKIVLTSAPETGEDVRRHQEWKDFAAALGLPILFDAQQMLRRPTVDFLLGADLCLTTSMAEGFGLAFLEPWLADRAIVGRDLPRVTADFQNAGLRLESLYPRLEVPVDDSAAVVTETEAQVRAACAAYEVPVEERFLQEAHSVVSEQGADFGRLDEARQRALIREAWRTRERRDLPQGGEIAFNRALIEQDFSLAKYGERLMAIYGLLLSAEAGPVGHLAAKEVLRRSLRFHDFTPLRN